MPHARKRHALPLFLKKLHFARVVTLHGCRQAGKSFFARELAAPATRDAKYLTLDQKSQKEFANDNPETFLQLYKDNRVLFIDEAQKAPPLFDAVKHEVDLDTRPGQYVLLGSTEFCRETRIRESLTGRVSRLRLYSMNIAECLNLPPSPAPSTTLLNEKPRVTRKEIVKHLVQGGFPGIFHLHDEQEREALLKDWVDITVLRDLQQFPWLKLDTELAYSALYALAQLEEPTASEISARTKKDTRAIQKLLHWLEILFVVHRVEPHPLGTGKPRYYLCDVSLAHQMGASFERKLETWFLHEQLSQRAYRKDGETVIQYYRTTKGSVVHFLISTRKEPNLVRAIKIIPTEKLDLREIAVLEAFRIKGSRAGIRLELFGLGSAHFHLKREKVRIYPWESIG